jgi:hypothetical protein
LAERLKVFADDVVGFVEACSDDNWRRLCASEDWSVGVAARHIGAGHFKAVDLVRMMVNGEKLPEITMEQLNAMANEHARQHAACTPTEVLEVLRQNSAAFVDYVAGLSDAELDRTGYLSLAGGELTAQQFIEAVVLKSGGEHLASMRAAVSQ